MSELYHTWQASTEQTETAFILPDGCRDLIVKYPAKQSPHYFISELFNSAQYIPQQAQTTTLGFRFLPGYQVDEIELLKFIGKHKIEADKIENYLEDFVHFEVNLAEALTCLAQVDNVKQATQELGVNIRSLQRLINKHTLRSPNYWLQLARVRKAARLLIQDNISLAATAHQFNYSDQSHMSREFQRWLLHSPKQVQQNPKKFEQLFAPAFS